MSDEDTKAALKEAIKEWLDDEIQQFGYFALKSLSAALFAAAIYFILSMNDWHK